MFANLKKSGKYSVALVFVGSDLTNQTFSVLDAATGEEIYGITSDRKTCSRLFNLTRMFLKLTHYDVKIRMEKTKAWIRMRMFVGFDKDDLEMYTKPRKLY